ncbi:MAG: DUF4912 domain-containing protein [Thermacetogeniaceae bacterium]
MAVIDLLLLVAIGSVLAIIVAGGYVFIFRKQFSFLKRPYPQTGERLSKHLPMPLQPTQREPDAAPGEPGGAESKPATSEAEGWRPEAGVLLQNSSTDAQAALLEEASEEFTHVLPRPAAAHKPETASASVMTSQNTHGIPASYGDCQIAALPRDPNWLFVYWEINEAKREEIARHFGHWDWDQSRPVLRVYDTTNLYFFDSRQQMEIAINDYANNWYIRTGQPNRTFCVELGRIRPDGSYIFLARSNFVSTPRDQISDVIDEEWLLLPEYTARLYARIDGIYPGPSSPGLSGPGAQISSPMNW